MQKLFSVPFVAKKTAWQPMAQKKAFACRWWPQHVNILRVPDGRWSTNATALQDCFPC
jgi:hypothetical protein